MKREAPENDGESGRRVEYQPSWEAEVGNGKERGSDASSKERSPEGLDRALGL